MMVMLEDNADLYIFETRKPLCYALLTLVSVGYLRPIHCVFRPKLRATQPRLKIWLYSTDILADSDINPIRYLNSNSVDTEIANS